MLLNQDLLLQLSDYFYDYFAKVWVKLLLLNKDFYPFVLYTLRKQRYIINRNNIVDVLSTDDLKVDHGFNMPLKFIIETDNLILFKYVDFSECTDRFIASYYPRILSTKYGNIYRYLNNLSDTIVIEIMKLLNDGVMIYRMNIDLLFKFIRRHKFYRNYSKILAHIVTSSVNLNNVSKELLQYMVKYDLDVDDYDDVIESIFDHESYSDTDTVRNIFNSDIFQYYIFNIVPINEYYNYILIAIRYLEYNLPLQLLQKYTEPSVYIQLIQMMFDMYLDLDKPQSARDLMQILVARDSSDRNYTNIIVKELVDNSDLATILVPYDKGSKDYTLSINENVDQINNNDLQILIEYDCGNKQYNLKVV